jgi:hypothetical protein
MNKLMVSWVHIPIRVSGKWKVEEEGMEKERVWGHPSVTDRKGK